MTSWCKKRLTYKTLLVRFGDGKHRFYLESVCGSSISDPTSNLCAHCTGVVQQTKTQDVGTFPHGLVTGPYTKESHLYDSPWYLAKVATYGLPSSNDLEMAKKAQEVAKTGKKIKTIECIVKYDIDGSSRNTVVLPTAPSNPVLSVESSKLLKPSNPVLSVESSKLLKPIVTAEVKPKKKRAAPKKKVVVIPDVKSDTTSSVLTQLGAIHETIVRSIPDTSETKVETMDTPLEVKTVVRVSLRPFTHGTATYWRDEILEKLYKRKSDGGLGPYIGRWDSNQETIVEDAPDSDEDY
jgi:hypothetical protein